MKHFGLVFPYLFFGLLFIGLGYIGVIDKEDFEKVFQGENKLEHKYSPSLKNELGDQLLLVYMGSSTCGACNVDYLPQYLEDLKLMLNQKAMSSSFSFKVIGVSKDWLVDEGIAHLNKFGKFDEIITGNNWLNLALMKYVWQDFLGPPGTPQLILIKRNITNHGSNGMNLYMVNKEEVILRKIGIGEIESWYNQNAPLPDL